MDTIQEDILGPVLPPDINTDSIDSIYIDGKKVARILIDGGVFYDNLPYSLTLSADKTFATAGDTINLTATCLNKQGDGCKNKTVEFINSDTEEVLGTAVTNSSGLATVSYSVQNTGGLNIQCKCGIIVSETYSIIDAIKYTSDGTGLAGTYNTGSDGTYDYITCLQSILDPQVSLTSSCEVSYKFKVTSTSGTGNGSLLWCIGFDANNCVLIGTEGNNNRMRIYSRSNGNNTLQQTRNNVYSLNTWFDVKITCNTGAISITVGGQTISYSLPSVAYFKTYTLNSYDIQLSQFIVKPL